MNNENIITTCEDIRNTCNRIKISSNTVLEILDRQIARDKELLASLKDLSEKLDQTIYKEDDEMEKVKLLEEIIEKETGVFEETRGQGSSDPQHIPYEEALDYGLVKMHPKTVEDEDCVEIPTCDFSWVSEWLDFPIDGEFLPDNNTQYRIWY